MKLRDLSSDEIGHALGRSGLILRVGPFTVAAHSRLREFRAALPLLYGGFTVSGPSEVVDIRVEIRGRRSFPAPWRRRAESLVNGRRSAAAQDRRLAPLLFEWGFNLWVGTRAHRYLILHAAVLERDGRALILPAPPGSGKSTLAAGLALGGWRLLSDEICLLRPEDGLAIPLPRPVALKRESIEIIRRFGGDPPMGPLMHGHAKGSIRHLVPPDEHVRRQAEPARPAWILLPRWQPNAPARFEPMTKAEVFADLVANATNYALLGADGFTALVRLVEECRCMRFDHGDLRASIAAIGDLTGVSPAGAAAKGTGNEGGGPACRVLQFS